MNSFNGRYKPPNRIRGSRPHNSKTGSRLWIYLFLLLWTLPLLVSGYEQQSLKVHDEALYATRARLMLDTGDWVNPWLVPHHKTPGIYWLLATLYRWLGMSETTVRLPSVIFSLFTVVLIYEIGSIVINHYVGFLAAVILNLQFLWLQYSRLGNPDLPTIFLTLLAIFCFLKGEYRLNRYRNLLAGIAGFCLGLATVMRGLMVGIPLVALTPYLILRNRHHHYLQNIWLYLGFVVGTIPLLTWLYLNWLRFSISTFKAILGFALILGSDNRHDHSIFYYFSSLASSAFPWGLLAILGLITACRSRLKYASILIGFPVITFVLISIYSTRLHHYSLGLYPFTALLSGLVLYCSVKPKQQEFYVPRSLRFFPVLTYIFTGLGITLFLAAIVLFYLETEPEYAKIALITSLLWLCLPFIYYKYSRLFWLAALLGGNWLGLFTAVNIGAVGNYEPEIKAFIRQPEVAEILNNNPVYILHGGGKTVTLFRFYLPNLEHNIQKSSLPNCSYAVSDAEYLASYAVPYKSVANFKDWQLIKTTNCPNLSGQFKLLRFHGIYRTSLQKPCPY